MRTPWDREEFREVIAAYLRTARAVDCEVSQIMVVNGSQHALDLSARVLLDPDTPVWIEEPGYELLRHTLTLSGCRLVPVPVDGEGLDVAAGIELCRDARAAFVTPSHQYPLGATMSAARRLQLLEWAHSSDAWIVEDDYDSEYRYESMPVASMQGLDPGSRVIYIGTFSKTLFPALRLGYIVIPPALVTPLPRGSARQRSVPVAPVSGGAGRFHQRGPFHAARPQDQAIVCRTPQCAGASAAERVRPESRSEMEILGAEAGMHLVVTLPPGLSDRKISARAARGRPLAVAALLRLRGRRCTPGLHSWLRGHEGG